MCLFSQHRGKSHPQRYKLRNAHFFPTWNGTRTTEPQDDKVMITMSVGACQLPRRHGWSMIGRVCDARHRLYVFHLWPLPSSWMCPPAIYHSSRDVRVTHRRKTFRYPCSNPCFWVFVRKCMTCVCDSDFWPMTAGFQGGMDLNSSWSWRGRSAGVVDCELTRGKTSFCSRASC